MLHPLVAVVMVLAIILMLCLRWKYVIAPLLLALFIVPMGQVLVLGGVHFTVARILILVGLVRSARERRRPEGGRLADGLSSIDRSFTIWACLACVIFSLQWMETQALIKSLGTFLDALGAFFVFRSLIRDREDVRRAISVFAVVAAVMAVCMTIEKMTRQNPFGLLGGVPIVPADRDGKVRAQGAFEIYLTAGVFGATLVPLFIWLWSDAKSRISAFVGMVSATVITITSYSSTPFLPYAAGLFAFCFWPVRQKMRLVRWGLSITLISLHLAMKGAVWDLIARVDLTGGSSGYHRSILIDNCVRHFSDWWLLGTRNYNTWAWDMWDLCDQYVVYAFTGGLATLFFFIQIISRSFGGLGTARKAARGNRKQEWFLWCLGAALFSHVVGYFGIAYYDQMQFSWYALLAMICAAIPEAMRSPVPQVREATSPNYHTGVTTNWEILETNR